MIIRSLLQAARAGFWSAGRTAARADYNYIMEGNDEENSFGGEQIISERRRVHVMQYRNVIILTGKISKF